MTFQQHNPQRALKEVLEDSNTYYKVRIAAAYALANLKSDSDDLVGQAILIEYFNQRYLSQSEDLQYTFHFLDISEYFVAAAVISAVGNCFHKDGYTSIDSFWLFLVNLANKYNSIWAFDDSGVVAAICEALGNFRCRQTDVGVAYLFEILSLLFL